MTRAALAALGAAALLTGCGGGDDDATLSKEPAPPTTTIVATTQEVTTDAGTTEEASTEETTTEEQAPRFTGDAANVYSLGHEFCSIVSVKDIAKEYNSRKNPLDAAHAYGQSFQRWAQIAAEAGCLDALLGRPSEVER